MMTELEQMMKCDMCYDRTSEGKRPMCATVCPSQALAYVPREKSLLKTPGLSSQEPHQGISMSDECLIPDSNSHAHPPRPLANH